MEHAVPQNITSFQFRLVGDMTLKQFGYLASGCILAYLTFLILFSHSPIISIILMFIFALAGVLFAFAPISDRPLDHWVLAFFKAVYSPTMGWWKNPVDKKVKVAKNDPVFNNRLQNYLISSNLEIASPLRLHSVQAKLTLLSQLPFDSAQGKPTPPLPKLIRMAPKTIPTPLPPLPLLPPILPIPAPLPPPVLPVIPLPPKFQPTTPIVTIEGKPKMVQKSLILTSLPNVVNGIITDFSGNYIENVIVIIHNADGVPVRASKTNKLGQFSGATPLPAGEYNVTFEKEGLNFETLKVNLINEILPALCIQPMRGNI